MFWNVLHQSGTFYPTIIPLVIPTTTTIPIVSPTIPSVPEEP